MSSSGSLWRVERVKGRDNLVRVVVCLYENKKSKIFIVFCSFYGKSQDVEESLSRI